MSEERSRLAAFKNSARGTTVKNKLFFFINFKVILFNDQFYLFMEYSNYIFSLLSGRLNKILTLYM